MSSEPKDEDVQVMEYHECSPWDRCGKQPCREAFCLDPDFLELMGEMTADREFCRKTWKFFRRPELLASEPESERSKYTSRFERCQRILNNWKAIKADIKATSELHWNRSRQATKESVRSINEPIVRRNQCDWEPIRKEREGTFGAW